ncbi:MAG: excinuclease ABC subunit UvrC, partial [Planctomycetota bacterium]
MSSEADPRPGLLKKVEALPSSPGVYIFSDASARVIYVGKATDLAARVRTYFAPGADDGRALFRLIVRRTENLECIVCANPLEALLLENNLIKKHRPRYNVRLRDDKTYISLRVTTAEKWPRVQLVRRWKDDGNVYFGPYSSSQSVREMLRVIKRYIPLRTCSNAFFRDRARPCLEHEIGRCSAPCVGLIDEAGYGDLVEETLLFLHGRNQTLLPILEARMEEAAESFEYERAARLRDQIAAIGRVMEKQRVEEARHGDRDVFGLHRSHDFLSVQVMLVREGRLVHSSTHSFRTPLADEEVLASFLGQYYLGDKYLPPEILMPVPIPESALLEGWLAGRRGSRVAIRVPRRGDKRRLVEMACRNAEVNSSTDELRAESRESLGRKLAHALGLETPVRRVECYDISNLQGSLSVASRVVFDEGEPEPSLYRRYKIRTVEGADDFRSMLEVLERRFRAGPGRDPLPDLVVVDGGKGQITSALAAIRSAGVEVPVIGLAKERRKEGEAIPERVFLPGRSEPLDLPQDRVESLLLQRIRDEAHRFANRYHRELRRKSALSTGLEEVPGIGPRRRRALLAHFGSL